MSIIIYKKTNKKQNKTKNGRALSIASVKGVWERKKEKKNRPEFDDVPTLKDETGPLSVRATSTQFQLSRHSQANTLGIRVELEVLKGES